jgi:hypothetical protein
MSMNEDLEIANNYDEDNDIHDDTDHQVCGSVRDATTNMQLTRANRPATYTSLEQRTRKATIVQQRDGKQHAQLRIRRSMHPSFRLY